jgi:hypothetical protein
VTRNLPRDTTAHCQYKHTCYIHAQQPLLCRNLQGLATFTCSLAFVTTFVVRRSALQLQNTCTLRTQPNCIKHRTHTRLHSQYMCYVHNALLDYMYFMCLLILLSGTDRPQTGTVAVGMDHAIAASTPTLGRTSGWLLVNINCKCNALQHPMTGVLSSCKIGFKN